MDSVDRLRRVVGIDTTMERSAYPDWQEAERLAEAQRFDHAETSMARVVDRVRSLPEANHRLLALALMDLAKCQWKLRRFEDADRTAREAQDLLGWEPSDERAGCLELRAAILLSENDRRAAIECYREALEVQKQIPTDAFLLTHRYRNLARAITRTDPGQAQDLYREAAEMARELEGSRSPLVADCLLDLGRLQALRGEWKAALATLKQAEQVEDPEYSKGSEKTTQVLAMVARSLLDGDDVPMALRFYDHALKLCEYQIGGDANLHAELLLGLAEAHAADDNDAGQLEALLQAVAKLEGGGDERLATALEAMGECCARMGRIEQSLQSFEKARKIWARDLEANDEKLDGNMVFVQAMKGYMPKPKQSRGLRKTGMVVNAPVPEKWKQAEAAEVPAAAASADSEQAPAAAEKPRRTVLPPARFKAPPTRRPVSTPPNYPLPNPMSSPGLMPLHQAVSAHAGKPGVRLDFVGPDGKPVQPPQGQPGGEMHLTVVVPDPSAEGEKKTKEVAVSMVAPNDLDGWDDLDFDLL